jgi:predicted phosphodiesterase
VSRRIKRILMVVGAVAGIALLAYVTDECVISRWLKPVFSRPLGGPQPALPSGADYSFAFMSDAHGNMAVMCQLLRQAAGAGCAFALHGGDTVYSCKDTDYQSFGEAVSKATSGRLPVYTVMGNHDVNGAMEALGDSEYCEYLGAPEYVFWCGSDAFVVMKDTDILFTPAQASRLDATLAGLRPSARNIFIACHVPPYLASRAGRHCLPEEDSKRLMAVARRYQVAMLLCGHIHAHMEENVEDIPVVVSGGAGGPLNPGAGFHYTLVTVSGQSVSVRKMDLTFSDPEAPSRQ